MFEPVFEGVNFSYFYEDETDQYLLLDNNTNSHVVVKGDDAFMFKEHIELIKINKDNTLNERIERVIEIHYNFETKPCPIPQFAGT